MYNTEGSLTGTIKNATTPHELSNVVYCVYSFHRGSDYMGRTSQRFYVRRNQHVTKKFILDGESRPNSLQSSVYENLVKYPNCKL